MSRRVLANGTLVPLVANTYGALGEEAKAFLEVARSVAKKRGREVKPAGLGAFVQSLVVFYTSGNVLAAYGVAPA